MNANIKKKIEITPAMIEAGAKVIYEEREELPSKELAREVYLAMEQKKVESGHLPQ